MQGDTATARRPAVGLRSACGRLAGRTGHSSIHLLIALAE